MNPTQQLRTIELNNSGASFIDNGDFESAIAKLSVALKASKKVIDGAVDDLQPENISLDECMAEGPIRLDEDEIDESVQQGFVYRQAIPIPTSIDCNYESSIAISVMIVFNLALAHQLYAAQTNSPAKLHKAAKLYGLSYNLQREESLQGTALFTMAVFNNLAVIYKQLDEEEEAGYFFQHLLSALMLLVDCDSGEKVQASHFDGFLKNTTFLICQPSVAAAA
jgi:tetratricopeptide (TPR) repeat protein